MQDGVVVAEGKLTLPELIPRQKAVIQIVAGNGVPPMHGYGSQVGDAFQQNFRARFLDTQSG